MLNMLNGIAQKHQSHFIENNREWLRQAQDLLEHISDREYTASPQQIAPHCVGGHLRHIVELYESFLDGLRSGHIDYYARKPDRAVETNRRAARAKLDTILQRLETEPGDADPVVWVRMEAARAGCITGVYAPSSVSRELQVLSGYAMHYSSLIALSLRAMGSAVEVGAASKLQAAAA